MVSCKKKQRSFNKRGNDYSENGEIAKVSINENLRLLKDGCIDSRKRHSLTFKKVHDESSSANDAVCDESIEETLHPILAKYNLCDVFNCDVNSLLYWTMPKGTTVKKLHGFKISKDRLTVLLCVNQMGKEKLQLLLIGKIKQPWCLTNVWNYPAAYEYSQNGWLTKLDINMKKQSRKMSYYWIMLPVIKQRTQFDWNNVRIEFLPANTTAKIEPLDQRIMITQGVI